MAWGGVMRGRWEWISVMGRWLLLLAVAGYLAPAAEAVCSAERAVIFNFGDSNSDTGGLSAGLGYIFPLPEGRIFFNRSTGRVCDGRLILDFLCESLNTSYLSPYLESLGSDFRNGANFAISGSTTQPRNQPFSLFIQVLQFFRFKSKSLELVAQGSKNLVNEEGFKNAIYMIDIGQNDLSAAFGSNASFDIAIAKIPSIIAEIKNAIKSRVFRLSTLLMASLIVSGRRVSLAPTVLAQIYLSLGQIFTTYGRAQYSMEIPWHYIHGWIHIHVVGTFSCSELPDRARIMLFMFAPLRMTDCYRQIYRSPHGSLPPQCFGVPLVDSQTERGTPTLLFRRHDSVILEGYIPNRVVRQFGLVQATPLDGLPVVHGIIDTCQLGSLPLSAFRGSFPDLGISTSPWDRRIRGQRPSRYPSVPQGCTVVYKEISRADNRRRKRSPKPTFRYGGPEKSYSEDSCLSCLSCPERARAIRFKDFDFWSIRVEQYHSTPSILFWMQMLHDTGSRNFWIHSTGPLGCLPQKLALPRKNDTNLDPYGCLSALNIGAMEFNSQLSNLCDELRSEYTDATIVYTDIYSIKYDLIANSTEYGFESPVMACCGYGGPPYNYNANITCGNSNCEVCSENLKYISWDGVHYSDAANTIVASKILSTEYSKPKLKFDYFCSS
ncbi:hypothetical protein M5K25_014008 [Dendrobium thyrsiflorum]|uniref:GDSL esterase/lipase n=1 Tax=Dendrobium thyrsiflorum TaxID=117978 RepID=A0ABD0UUJ0_DENTH